VNQGDLNSIGPEIEIDGSASITNGFTIQGSANKIRGFIINLFPLYGVYIEGDQAEGNIIVGNYIGTDFTGMAALDNPLGGIFIGYGSSHTHIGSAMPEDRNIISGASRAGNLYSGNGITMRYSDDNIIFGNFIGTNKDGTGVLENLKAGIVMRYCSNNVIGGLESGESNVISGNGWCGKCIRSEDSRKIRLPEIISEPILLEKLI
jgi:titin